jgi:hypothetical protein
MPKLRVLVVDDAVVVRRLVSDALNADPDLEVCGTASNGTFLRDTWEWDGANWNAIAPLNLPPAQYGHALAYDSVRNVTVLYPGAFAQDLLHGFFALDFARVDVGNDECTHRGGFFDVRQCRADEGNLAAFMAHAEQAALEPVAVGQSFELRHERVDLGTGRGRFVAGALWRRDWRWIRARRLEQRCGEERRCDRKTHGHGA